MKFSLFIILFLSINIFNIYGQKYLIGVSPFTNLRPPSEDDILGYYLQHYIIESLKKNSNWNFHQIDTIDIWHKTKQVLPITPSTDYHIHGSYLSVFKKGKIYITLVSFLKNSAKTESKKFEFTYDSNNIDKQLTNIINTIGKDISPEFNISQQINFPILSSPLHKEVLKLRKIRFEGTLFKQKEYVLELKKKIQHTAFLNKIPLSEEIYEVSISLLIISQFLDTKEQHSLLQEIEKLIRFSLSHYSEHALLQALHSEVLFFLKKKRWIAEKARKSILLDSQVSLGYFMLGISKGIETEQAAVFFTKLHDINPYLIPSIQKKLGIYQSGIFDFILLPSGVQFLENANEVTSQQEFEDRLSNAIQLLQQQPEQGILELNLLIKEYPDTISPFLEKSKYLTKKKEYQESLDTLLSLEIKFSESTQLYTQIGDNYYYLKQYPLADNYLMKALSLEPDYIPAMYRMSLVKMRSKKPDEAIVYIDTLLKLKPKNSAFWYQKGLAYWHLKRWEEAIKSWETSIQLNPKRKNIIQPWLNKAKENAK